MAEGWGGGYQTPQQYFGISEADAARLPLGMRLSNNPYNIKYFQGAEKNQTRWPGLIGPSEARDQGDPQMRFATPDHGAASGAGLMLRKYDSGMKSAYDIIAGNKGWTPGYNAAAENVARIMNIKPTDDLNLRDHVRLVAFQKALAEQEHGQASRMFPASMYENAARMALGGPATGNSRSSWTAYDIDNDPNPPQTSGAPSTQRAPTMTDAPNSNGLGLLGNFAHGLNSAFTSPLFQSGAAMFAAGAGGKDIGTGFMMGGEAARRMQMGQMQEADMRRKMAQQTAVAQAWAGLDDPNSPISAGMTPGQRGAIKALGPEAGAPLLMSLIQGKAQQELANSDPLRQAQIANIPLERQRLEAQIAQAQRKDTMGEAQARILQGTFPELFSGQGAAPPNQNIRPQSFDATQSAVPGIQFVNDGQRGALPPQSQQSGVQPWSGMDPRKAMGLAMIPGMGDAAKIAAEAYNQNRLGKEGQNKIDEKSINASEQQARLASIRSLFRPEFQQFETKAKMTFKALSEKFKTGGVTLNEADEKMLTDYTTFRAEAFDNLNQYVKEITGAAMTNAEAERIMKAIPNPGDNWWDGDSPTQFKAKLDGAVRKTQLALARMEYAKREGKSWQAIPLTNMPKIIDERGNQIEREARRQGIKDESEINGMVRQRLRAEFGIDS